MTRPTSTDSSTFHVVGPDAGTHSRFFHSLSTSYQRYFLHIYAYIYISINEITAFKYETNANQLYPLSDWCSSTLPGDNNIGTPIAFIKIITLVINLNLSKIINI